MSSLLNDVVSDVKLGLGVREKLINNKKFSLTLLPADEGLAVAFKLFAMLGPSVASIADSSRTEEYKLPEEDDLYTQAVLHLVSRMSDVPDVIKVIKTVTRELKVNGNLIEFNDYFKGNYGELISALKFCLEENFKDAFMLLFKEKGSIRASLDMMMPKKEAKPEAPSEE